MKRLLDHEKRYIYILVRSHWCQETTIQFAQFEVNRESS